MIKLHIQYLHLGTMIAMFNVTFVPDKHEIISVEQNNEVKEYDILERYTHYRKGETVVTLMVKDRY